MLENKKLTLFLLSAIYICFLLFLFISLFFHCFGGLAVYAQVCLKSVTENASF